MVCSGHRQESSTTCSEELDTVRTKGLKRRGLSRFYSERSQSFASLELVLTTSHGESTMALGKRSTSSVSDDRDPSSSAFSCTLSLVSQSLPASPCQTTSSDNTLLQPYGSCGPSHSEGGNSWCNTYGDAAASLMWQQQAAVDICSALHLRCSLDLNHTSQGLLDEDIASSAPLTFPKTFHAFSSSSSLLAASIK